ncbi:single-stranded DNA-binding protein [Dolichospermum sp. UHCC 0352]|uniref:single-stranded DNA-binding protein n=1 Tax=Dolichospermum sp. UHCC 0352 TaxID=2590011 RepID=UPI00352F8DD2
METKQIYTSFIHWFGSHGKNYGFIVRPEDIDSFSKMSKYEKYQQGYRFDEENIIDQKFLGYLKKDKKLHGKGIYVQFELIPWENGKTKAINVQLSKDIGTINHPDFFVKSLIVNINLNLLSLKEIEFKIHERTEFLQDLQAINPELRKELKELSEKIPAISIKYSALRDCLTTPFEYARLVNKYIDELDKNLQYEIVEELRNKIQSTNSYKKIDYYLNNIKYPQEYKGYLWKVTPKEYKLEKIKERYQKFFTLVKKFAESGYPDEHKICGKWQELYSLNQDEQELIKEWIDKDNDDEFVKMVAARGAEKLVAKYYESIGYDVEDISIKQVENHDGGDWKKYDIRITKEKQPIYLDVKNARSSQNSKVYSSFCVRKLKEYREQDIKIIGVLSPLLYQNDYQSKKSKKYIHIIWYCANKLNEEEKIELEDNIKDDLARDKKSQNQNITKNDILQAIEKEKQNQDICNSEQIKILGTFDKRDISELKELFLGESLARSINISNEGDKPYYPHWLFDYDDDFYVNQIKIIEEFRNLTNEEIPSYEAYQEFNSIKKQYNALPLFLAAKRKLPNDWRKELSEWRCKFIDNILNIKSQRIKLPHIFLAILKHFLSMIGSNSNNQDYDPLKYLEILYTHQNLDEDPHPLKIYDPVKDQHPNSSKKSPTIINFCETLNILYSRRENLKLNEFVKFHFQGKGLLQGTKLGSNEKTRILAYCGKCGYPHIIRNEELGKNYNICNTCKRLVCPKCQYCNSKWEKDNQNKNIEIYCPGYIARTKSINIVILVGRVNADPNVKYFDSGKIKCNLYLAVDRHTKKGTDLFKLEMWNKMAKIAEENLREDSLIAVQGTLGFETWRDDKTKVNRSQPVIKVEKLDLLDPKLNQQYNLNDW